MSVASKNLLAKNLKEEAYFVFFEKMSQTSLLCVAFKVSHAKMLGCNTVQQNAIFSK